MTKNEVNSLDRIAIALEGMSGRSTGTQYVLLAEEDDTVILTEKAGDLFNMCRKGLVLVVDSLEEEPSAVCPIIGALKRDSAYNFFFFNGGGEEIVCFSAASADDFPVTTNDPN